MKASRAGEHAIYVAQDEWPHTGHTLQPSPNTSGPAHCGHRGPAYANRRRGRAVAVVAPAAVGEEVVAGKKVEGIIASIGTSVLAVGNRNENVRSSQAFWTPDRMRTEAPLSTLLRNLFLISIAILLFMMITRPTQFRTFGQKARTLGLIYVLAVLISAALYLLGLRG